MTICSQTGVIIGDAPEFQSSPARIYALPVEDLQDLGQRRVAPGTP